MGRAFRSLRRFNYGVWSAGALVSNIGTWMQRTAQDWLVLTQLTHNNARAVGLVIALQFGPQVLFLPLTRYAVFDRLECINLTSSLSSGNADIPFIDSRDRVIAAMNDLKTFAGATFPHYNGEAIANAHVVIDEEP